MKDKLVHYFSKETSNWKFWVFWALIFKLAFFIFKIFTRTHMVQVIDGFWGNTDTDTSGYFGPIENFIRTGNYTPDYRMPGYGLFYLPFALIFPKAIACNLIIITQLVLSALSVYALSITAKLVFKNEKYFYFTFFLYAISCYTCSFDTWLMTECLTTSCLIFSVYYLVKFSESGRILHIFLSGMFLTWCIFCRPVFAPLLFFFVIFALMKAPKKLIAFVVFFIPFLISDSIWIFHNYNRYNAICPLLNNQHSFFNPIIGKTENANRQYFNDINNPDSGISFNHIMNHYGQAWGAPDVYDPNNIFNSRKYENGKYQTFINLAAVPAYSFTSKFNKDSLQKLNQLMDTIRLHTTKWDNKTETAYAILLTNKIKDYTTSLKNEKPFVYYVKAPLILMKRFLFNSGSPVLLDTPVSLHTPILFALKILFAILYYLVVIFAVLGILLKMNKILRFKSLEFLVMGIVLYVLIIHPLILRYSVTRYLVPAYPFMVILSVVGILWITDKFKKRINNQIPSTL